MDQRLLVRPRALPWRLLLGSFLAALGGTAGAASGGAGQGATPADIVAAAPVADWRNMAADDLLVMTLAPQADGKARTVVIQLMSAPFSQGWIGNIRLLAKSHWWDGTSINRAQDNYVVQWGDASEKKPLPKGIAAVPESDYSAPPPASLTRQWSVGLEGWRAEFHGAIEAQDRARIHDMLAALARGDAYADKTGFFSGWPYGSDRQRFWPLHCYGAVGVGRNLSPDTGSGAELYAVIGQAPRHLDRNIAVVGRVVSGMEHLSSLPRGTGQLGFYEDAAQRVPILSVRLASDLPEAERPRLQYLATESASFAAYAHARANRQDAFFTVPAGGADICNIPVPIRKAP